MGQAVGRFTRTYCEAVAISSDIWQPPTMTQEPPHARLTTLDSLPAGVSARVMSVDWSALVAEEAQRLRALGIDVGARLQVAHRGVFFGRDPLAISVGRMTVALRRAHARAMQVLPISDEAPA